MKKQLGSSRTVNIHQLHHTGAIINHHKQLRIFQLQGDFFIRGSTCLRSLSIGKDPKSWAVGLMFRASREQLVFVTTLKTATRCLRLKLGPRRRLWADPPVDQPLLVIPDRGSFRATGSDGSWSLWHVGASGLCPLWCECCPDHVHAGPWQQSFHDRRWNKLSDVWL